MPETLLGLPRGISFVNFDFKSKKLYIFVNKKVSKCNIQLFIFRYTQRGSQKSIQIPIWCNSYLLIWTTIRKGTIFWLSTVDSLNMSLLSRDSRNVSLWKLPTRVVQATVSSFEKLSLALSIFYSSCKMLVVWLFRIGVRCLREK